jgi:hypothetical protein
VRPIGRPSSFARRIPARTLSTIKLFSNSTTERADRIDRFTLGEKLDPQFAKLVEHLEEVLRAASEAIARPNQHGIKFAAMSVLKQLIKCGSPDLRAAHAMIDLFVDNLVAMLMRELAQPDPLAFWILVEGRDAEVQGCAFHATT